MNENRPVAILLLLLLIAALLGAYFLFIAKETYPFARTIVSTDGKPLDVLIVGRTGDMIHFDRLSDNQRFEIPVSKLSWKDRLRAIRYPEQQPPKLVIEKPKPKPIDPYIKSRLKLIDELNDRAVLYNKEIASGTLNDLMQNKRREQLSETLMEIKELEVAIETYKWRTKQN